MNTWVQTAVGSPTCWNGVAHDPGFKDVLVGTEDEDVGFDVSVPVGGGLKYCGENRAALLSLTTRCVPPAYPYCSISPPVLDRNAARQYNH